MPQIKRYPNRKLYNTETKRYITLDGIAVLIRNGEEVQVIDHVSGEDLTSLTLTQIIFEQEKKRSGFLPQSILTGLIQSSGERIGSLKKTLAAPREMLGPVEQEIDRRIQALIKTGELASEEGRKFRDKMLTNFNLFGKKGEQDGVEIIVEEEIIVVDDSAENDAEAVDSAEELQALTEQLDALTAKVNDLLAEKSAENSPSA